MPTLAHRLATAGDFERVYAIYMDAEVVPYLGYDAMPADAFRPIYAELLASGSFFVVEVDGVVQGFYRATRQAGRSTHVVTLTTFAVAPSAIGSGLARALMEDVIARFHAQGVRRVDLTVEADNARGIAFYRKLGFEHEGTLRAAYKRAGEDAYLDELVMARLLPPLTRVSG